MNLILGSAAAVAAQPPFTIVDEMLGTGPAALRMKTLKNIQTGEYFSVIWELGGKTEALRLRSARGGHLRDALQCDRGTAGLALRWCHPAALCQPHRQRHLLILRPDAPPPSK